VVAKLPIFHEEEISLIEVDSIGKTIWTGCFDGSVCYWKLNVLFQFLIFFFDI
jgi:WD40 repeat protein